MKYRDSKRWLGCLCVSAMASMAIGSVCAAGAAGDTDALEQTEVLPTYVVTANRISPLVSEANANITVVTRKQIEAMHMTNVEQALRTVPGVTFLNYGPNGINANLSGVRIDGSKNIVVLVNGVRINEFQGPDNGGYMYASLLNDMDNIEEIEVLRGSSSLKYGSAAEGGVINIVTREVKGTHTTVGASGGTAGNNYNVDTMGASGKMSYHAYLNKTHTGDIKDASGKEWRGYSNDVSAGASINYTLRPNQHLQLTYNQSRSDFAGQDLIYKTPYDGTYHTRQWGLTHYWNINGHLDNRFVYRYDHVESTYGQGTGYSTASEHSYHFLSNQLHFTDAYNQTLFGIDYGKAKVPQVWNAATATFVPHTLKEFALYVEENWNFAPKATLSVGLRHDSPSSSGNTAPLSSHNTTSYRLSYQLTPKDTIYASHSGYYVLPSVNQWYDKKYGNPSLVPAEGHTTQVGYTHAFTGKRVLAFHWFDTKEDHGIGYAAGTGKFINTTDGVARGWNLAYTATLSPSWWVTAGWSHLYQHAKGDNYSLGYSPKNLLTWSAIYTKNKWTAGVDGFYFMRRVDSANANEHGWPSNNYAVWNASVTYKPVKDVEVYMRVNNVFNKLWAEQTNVIWGGGPGSWYAMPGRNYSIGARIRF